jgi:hypothetical protein
MARCGDRRRTGEIVVTGDLGHSPAGHWELVLRPSALLLRGTDGRQPASLAGAEETKERTDGKLVGAWGSNLKKKTTLS